MPEDDVSVRKNIRDYFQLQFLYTPLGVNPLDHFNPSEEYPKIKEFIKNENKPVILQMYSSDPYHAVVGYKIIEYGSQPKIDVPIYDNNWPFKCLENNHPPVPVAKFDMASASQPFLYRIEKKDRDKGECTLKEPIEYNSYTNLQAVYPVKSITEGLGVIIDHLIDAGQSLLGQLKDGLLSKISFWSPIRPLIIDASGRRVGYVGEDLVNEIPGAEIVTMGEATTIYVPANLDITIEGQGTAEGTFDLDIVRISATDGPATVISFQKVAINSNSKVTMRLTNLNPDYTVDLDENGDGTIDQSIAPDSILVEPGFAPIDVTARVRVDASIAGYNRRTGDTTVNLTVTNTSGDAIRNPITVVFVSFSEAAIRVTNPDGQTNEGKDFVDFSALIPDGELSPGEVTPIKQVKLANPNKARLDFQVSVFGVVNTPGAAPPLKPQFAQPIHLVLPLETALAQNYPNPFNPETWIPFDLAEPGQVTIEIYDLRGHQVRALHLGWLPVGSYVGRDKAAHWDGRNDVGKRVASGVYFYRFITPTFQRTKQMVILK